MQTITYNKISADLQSKLVTSGEKEVSLHQKEYELLVLFLKYPDQIFDYERIINELWDIDHTPTESNVRSHIKEIRKAFKKIDNSITIIENLYGIGYRLNPLFNPNNGYHPLTDLFFSSLDIITKPPLELVQIKKYLVINKNFKIKYISSELLNDCHYSDQFRIEEDIRNICPEFIELETILEKISNSKNKVLVFKAMKKPTNGDTIQYANFYLISAGSHHSHPDPDQLFYLFFENIANKTEILLEK
jgi:DNA-binding winged helix-turn-helix (wHTH) protein